MYDPYYKIEFNDETGKWELYRKVFLDAKNWHFIKDSTDKKTLETVIYSESSKLQQNSTTYYSRFGIIIDY